MRHLLLLSYWVPGRSGIGTVRSSHLLKHLRTFGWNVTVVTARLKRPDNAPRPGDYIETPCFDVKGTAKRFLRWGNRTTPSPPGVRTPHGETGAHLRRFAMGAADLLTYRDEYVGWLPFASYAVRSLVATGRYDALLSSAPPMTANVAAALGHGRLPWIADLRDLWAEDDSSERWQLQKLFDDKFERAVLSGAAALIASSHLSAARFVRRYPTKPCFAVFTGFDAHEWEGVGFGREDRCTLLYAGTLYRGKRDPSILFAALRELFDERPTAADQIRVDFYTPQEDWLTRSIARFNLGNVVRVHGFRPRDTVLRAQRRADRLIVLAWDGPTAEGVVAGKLFEYFGARRPILAIGGPQVSEVEQLLQTTRAGIRCIGVRETKAEIVNALREHSGAGERVLPFDAVQAYSAEACAKQFAEVLDSVVAARAGIHVEDAAQFRPLGSGR